MGGIGTGGSGRLLVLGLGAWVLAACATTDPYAARYDRCDQEAGACYRDCRELDDPRRREACQQRCTTAVNRCFAEVRSLAERQASYRRPPDAVFYGRYGYWDPYAGYRYGRHDRRYSYSGYGYGFDRYGYDRWGYDRYGYDRYGYDRWGRRGRGGRRGPDVRDGIVGAVCRDGRCDQPRGGDDGRAPTGGTVRAEPDDGRYRTEDGSVFTEEGRRLRYGGRPEARGDAKPAPRRSNGVQAAPRSGNPTVRPSAPERPAARPNGGTSKPEAKLPTRRTGGKPAPRRPRADRQDPKRNEP